MKILITADLHYDIARSRKPTERLARRACREGGDGLVLVGDTAGADTDVLRDCLRLFADFPGRKMLVPGNHCLWRTGNESSMERYERTLPAVVEEEGFVYLDQHPQVLGRLGLVGSVGWYDYTFHEESLGIPRAFYREKVTPGAAKYLGGYEELLAAHEDDLTDEQLEIRSRWMDGMRADLGMSDEAFVALLADRLAAQLRRVAPRVERIIAFVHHLPFEQLVPRGRPGRYAFAAAYMGSPRFGEVLLACPKVTDVYCGHSHWAAEEKIEHIRAVSVGSTYDEKKLEVLEA